MGKLTLVVPTIVVSFFCVLLKAKEIHVNIICDELLYPSCVKQVTKLNQTYIPSVISDDLYSLKYDLKEGSDNLILNYQNFNITNDWWNIFLVFGNSITANAASTVATSYHLPIFLYDTSYWKHTVSIFNTYISVRHFVLETHCKYI
jgi:hypothetical protein